MTVLHHVNIHSCLIFSFPSFCIYVQNGVQDDEEQEDTSKANLHNVNNHNHIHFPNLTKLSVVLKQSAFFRFSFLQTEAHWQPPFLRTKTVRSFLTGLASLLELWAARIYNEASQVFKGCIWWRKWLMAFKRQTPKFSFKIWSIYTVLYQMYFIEKYLQDENGTK